MISKFWPWGDISSNKPRVLIFGTGAGGNNFYKRNRRRYRVLAFLDNNRERQGQSLFGKKILPPEIVRSISFDKIIIASDYFREILPQLLSYGVRDIDILVLKEYDHDNNSFKDRLFRYLTAAICRYTCRHVGIVSRVLLSGLAQRVLRPPYIELKRAEILWLDMAAAYKICEFRPEMDCNVQPPRFLGTIAAPVPIRLPAVSAYRFATAAVSSGSRSVILEKANTVVLERVTTATDVDGDYSQTDIYYHTADHALVRSTTTETLPSGVIINCSNEVNYYHWMIDALAQLQFCEELPVAYADYPILISATSQKMEAIRAMIESIAPRRRMVFLKNLHTYVVTDLLYISQPNNMLPHLRHGSCYEARYAFARPESVLFLREKGLHLSRAIDTSNRPRRIILARRGSLRQYNQDELISMGQIYGFSPIYLEDMPFAEQVAIVANATMIIGPSGAAWTNLLFASSEARGLCWAAAEQGDASCFSNLAAIVGMKLDHLAYAGGTDNTRFLHSRAYQLDISKVETWMNATIIEMESRSVPS